MAKLRDESGQLGSDVGVADVVAVPEGGGEAADGGRAAPLAQHAVDVPCMGKGNVNHIDGIA